MVAKAGFSCRLCLLAAWLLASTIHGAEIQENAKRGKVLPVLAPGLSTDLPSAVRHTGLEGKVATRPGARDLIALSNQIAATQAKIEGEISEANTMAAVNQNYIKQHKAHIQKLKAAFDKEKSAAVRNAASVADMISQIEAPISLSTAT
eukprot:jgi/Bigna1/74047/fgenesh1_pg.27_\